MSMVFLENVSFNFSDLNNCFFIIEEIIVDGNYPLRKYMIVHGVWIFGEKEEMLSSSVVIEGVPV